jgi:hypothetical protein
VAQMVAPAGLRPDAGGIGQPVFVLCGGRSGSTLLRFLLDAHPELACPPETNLPGMAAQLATVRSLISGAPLSKERGDEPPEIPDDAIRGVRRTLDDMLGSYLSRHRKRRLCGTVRAVSQRWTVANWLTFWVENIAAPPHVAKNTHLG